MERISIIVPVYNVFPYLEKCVESLIRQSYREIEILLIDDGSTDGSGALCNKLAETDIRIQVFHQKNRGLSGARNLGIEMARGEYLCFVDSDDWVEEKYCETLYQALKKEKTGIALCGFKKVSEKGTENIGKSKKEEDVTGIKDDLCYPTDKVLAWLSDWKSEEYTRLVVTWNKLYERNCFDRIRYPEGKLHEDEFVVHRVLDTQKAIALVPQELYFYRQRPDSIMGKNDYAVNFRHSDVLEAFEDRICFYREKNRKAFLDAFHNYMRAANSYYEIYSKQPGRVYLDKAEAILINYRNLFRKNRGYFGGRDVIRFGVFAYVPKIYSTVCSLKYAIDRDGEKH